MLSRFETSDKEYLEKHGIKELLEASLNVLQDKPINPALAMAEDLKKPQCRAYVEWDSVGKKLLQSVQQCEPNCCREPVATHPIFFGCYDWHSAVHSHWSLLKVLDIGTSGGVSSALCDEIKTYLDKNFTADNVQGELASLLGKPADWELPYGMAWYMIFIAHLRRRGCRWLDTFRPLSDEVCKRMEGWLTNLGAATRTGWHSNTAYALTLLIEATTGDIAPALNVSAIEAALRLFLIDKAVQDPVEEAAFLSPSLCQAELVGHFWKPGAQASFQSYHDWLQQAFHQDVWQMHPVHGDVQDGYGSHTCGLNFHRAGAYAAIASHLLRDPCCRHPIALLNRLTLSAQLHFEQGKKYLVSDSFMGNHWLPSFAMRAQVLINQLNVQLKIFSEWHEAWPKVNPQKPLPFVASIERPWTTVRVFVSSTFADMFHEREILVKQVFPQLAVWAEKRKLNIIVCDLRWGVPKDSTTSVILTTCLAELDRCQKDNTHPFFLGLLSHRYGWVPEKSKVPTEIVQTYDWIDGFSVTHMEIMHGAFRELNPNALFLFRNPSFLADLPSDNLPAFVSESSDLQKLQTLKDQIRVRFPKEAVFDYSAKFGRVDSNNKVLLTGEGMDAFAQRCLEFLQEQIGKAYPPQKNMSPHKTEELSHEEFVQHRADFVVGRDDEVRAVLAYFNLTVAADTVALKVESDAEFAVIDVSGDGNLDKGEIITYFKGMAGNVPEGEIWDLILFFCKSLQDAGMSQANFYEFYRFFVKAWSHPFVVEGEAGCGKSVLMAKVVQDFKSANEAKAGVDKWLVLYHFIGCSPGSTLLERLLIRIGRLLEGHTWKPPTDEAELSKILTNLLLRASGKGKKVAIFIDALNQLDESMEAQDLAWLPHWLPPNIKIVVSVLPGRPLDVLKAREPPCPSRAVGAITEEGRGSIVKNTLAQQNKVLDNNQMAMLMEKSGATNPLYLKICCDELRVFGVFEKVNQKIAALPDELLPLLQQVFQRLILEHGEPLLIAFCLLECSRHGLLETELMELLAEKELKWSFRVIDLELSPSEQPQHLDKDETQKSSVAADKLKDKAAAKMKAADHKQAVGADDEGRRAFKQARPLITAQEWAQISAAMSSFTRACGADGGIVDFYHRIFSKAVRKFLFDDRKQESGAAALQPLQPLTYEGPEGEVVCLRPKVLYHGALANYFETSNSEDRRTQELPFQLVQILDNNRLLRMLVEWKFF